MSVWPDSPVLQARLCGFMAFMAPESEWALSCGSMSLMWLKAVSASEGPIPPSETDYTDLPMLRGTYVPPGDSAKRAPEWSPLLRGHPPLFVFAPLTQGRSHGEGEINGYWLLCRLTP